MIGNPFSPEGRMRRRTYVLTLLVVNVLGLALNLRAGGSMPIDAVIGFAGMLILLWPMYCAMTKRLHDADRTSTTTLVSLGLAIAGSFFLQTAPTLSSEQLSLTRAIGSVLIMAGGAVALFVLVARPTSGPNRYGEDPREPDFVEIPVDGPPPSAYDGA